MWMEPPMEPPRTPELPDDAPDICEACGHDLNDGEWQWEEVEEEDEDRGRWLEVVWFNECPECGDLNLRRK